MKNQYIFLCGARGAGKDTIAEMIRNQWSSKTHIHSFAQPIKDCVKCIFPIDDIDSNKNKKIGGMFVSLTYRDMIIKVGQGLKDIIDNNIWVHCLEQRTKKLEGYIIVPDLRQEHELKYAKGKANVLIVEVTRPGKELVDCDSEKFVKEIKAPIKINNNGTIEDLYQQVRVKLFPFLDRQIMLTSGMNSDVIFEEEYHKIHGIPYTWKGPKYTIDVPIDYSDMVGKLK